MNTLPHMAVYLHAVTTKLHSGEDNPRPSRVDELAVRQPRNGPLAAGPPPQPRRSIEGACKYRGVGANVQDVMTSYLSHGWYTRVGRKRLRNEVIDGAIDAASMLYRAGVTPERVSGVALKVRTLATIADPPHRRLLGRFSSRDRRVLVQRLEALTDGNPPLQCFAADCLEHVYAPNDLRAFYLHLVHITNMMQLLAVAALTDRVRNKAAKGSPTERLSSGGQTTSTPRRRAKRPKSAAPARSTRSTGAAEKRATKKKATKKKAATPRTKTPAKTASGAVTPAKKVARKKAVTR
jgi:hypothetical protein